MHFYRPEVLRMLFKLTKEKRLKKLCLRSGKKVFAAGQVNRVKGVLWNYLKRLFKRYSQIHPHLPALQGHAGNVKPIYFKFG